MPRRTCQRTRYPLPIRCLAILLAVSVSVPGLAAQSFDGGGSSYARKTRDWDYAGPANAAPIPRAADNSDENNPLPKLRCGDGLAADAVLSQRNSNADQWGDITVAQPKIWQFERMSALLDGLLRDVEGVSLQDLTQLDPSQQNAAALKFIQSALEVGVQYDQAGAVNAANTLSNYNSLHASQTQQLDQYNSYMQTLTSERDRLTAQYSAASNEVNALQALKAAGNLTDAQQKQLDEATSREASTSASLASVNSLISGAGAAPTLSTPPTVTGTSVQKPASGSDMSSSLMGFSEMLKSLPSGVQNNLSAALNAPSYPATKRLDNFITLLYERLAREISVLQDDLTRDPDNVAFLLQFDVGLYPSKKAKDHVARVEFNLDCPGCKVYSLYPGQSSYNLANYSGSSKRNTFWGNALTLIGLGVSASYRRQTDALQGSLVQSVYTAGFQNGVLDDEAPRSHTKVDADLAEQSFGWYYGAAPFEQLVTPGIRSTFALVTVPRKLIDKTADKFGNADACVPLHIDAAWANRNDPVAQDGHFSAVAKGSKYFAWPVYHATRHELIEPKGAPALAPDASEMDATHAREKSPADSSQPPYGTSVRTVMTSVKLPASLNDYSLVANREKKMHVLRMEYNTVYEKPDPADGAAVVQTTVQTNTQSTNPATGQTTAQSTSQTTGTAVAVGKAASANAAATSNSALNPLPCAEGKCAPILLKLDRPIDPNLVVTVRGEPLMRVRDWRGRATSVLPAAQSGTDLTGSAAAAGSITLNQLKSSRSLLETDQVAPNTWFALNSHELLLNVSIDVATEDEFPVIQLADPSETVVIPYDLRRSFTELIVDGFRMRPQTEYSIQREVGRQNWRDNDSVSLDTCPNGADAPNCIISSGQGDAPISSGPFAFSTYTPLFSPDPAPRRFFAMIGETGDDLILGVAPRSPAQNSTDKTSAYDWLTAQTRVILEDRHQDFAWSLSCDEQGDFLACRLPREEISRAYLNFLRACPDEQVCPGLEIDWRSLLQSVDSSLRPLPATVQILENQEQILESQQMQLQELELQNQQLQQQFQMNQQRDQLQQRQQDLNKEQQQLREQMKDTPGPGAIDTPLPNPRRGGQPVRRDETAAARTVVTSFATDSHGPPIDTSLKPHQENQSSATTTTKIVAKYRAGWLKREDDLKRFSRAFVSTMQLWVEQSDPEGKSVFYSPEPVPLTFLPLSSDYSSITPFQPWKFETADANSVTLHECNYLPNASTNTEAPDELYVSVLGVRSWQGWLRQSATNQGMKPVKERPFWGAVAADPREPRCGRLILPTAALANDPLMLSMEFPPHPTAGENVATPALRTTVALPQFRIGPSFEQRHVQIRPYVVASPASEGKATVETKGWRILIPTVRTTCADNIELSPVRLTLATLVKAGNLKPGPGLGPTNGIVEQGQAVAPTIDVQWLNGNDVLKSCPSTGPAYDQNSKDWSSADEAGRINLYLDIPRAAINDLPERIDVVRTTTDGVKWVVGTLPDLRRLLLPSKLTLQSLGPSQFALIGEKAGVIDAVSVQSSSDASTREFRTAPGIDFALVTLPPPTPDTKSTDTSGAGGSSSSTSSTQITIDTTKDNTDHVTMTTNSNSNPPKAGAPDSKTATTPSPDDKTSTPLPAGSYAVIPLLQIGSTPPDMAKLKADEVAAAKDLADAQAAVQKATKALDDAKTAKAAPADQDKLTTALDNAKSKLTSAQTKATAATNAVKTPQSTPIYMPLNVSNEQGKPLIFTVADTKKQNAAAPPTTPPASSTTTCAAPCVLVPCTASCPPAPSPAATPKSQ